MTKTPPNPGDHSELGIITAAAIERLMALYSLRKHRDTIMHRELIAFENRRDGRNEWVQAVVSIVTDPMYFYPDGQSHTGWAPLPLSSEVIRCASDMLLRILDTLQANDVPGTVCAQVVDASEQHMVKLAQLINDIKNPKNP